MRREPVQSESDRRIVNDKSERKLAEEKKDVYDINKEIDLPVRGRKARRLDVFFTGKEGAGCLQKELSECF